MYIMNGIVYGNSSNFAMKVTSAKPLSDMIMILTFSNGETRLFDATTLQGPVYDALREPKIFRDIIIDHGVVTWDKGQIDCAPEYMYENSCEYSYDSPTVCSSSTKSF